jgi:type IV pilus assembly protein PilN
MIRINLLQVDRGAKTTRRGSSRALSLGSATQQVPLVCAAILGAAVLYVGYSAWTLFQREQTLQHELQAAREEEAKLQPVLKQYAAFEARKKQLEQRVTLIEDLRRGQPAAVHLVDEVSKSVPDRLWLTELKQTGDSIQMDGQTSTLTALADYIGNLENTGYFERPVEIISTTEEKVQNMDIVKFSIKATFSMPGSKTPEKKPAPPGQGAAAGVGQPASIVAAAR